MNRSRVVWMILSIAVGAVLILFWQYLADSGTVSRVFLPGARQSWSALLRGMSSGHLAPMLLDTIERMLLGWLVASLVGVFFGALIGLSPNARAYLKPSLEVLRPLPASAIIPLAIAALGLSESMILTVIVFGALWPMLLATLHGFESIEPRLVEVGRSLGLTRVAFIRNIALPSALPDIFAGMRIGLTISLILAVVSEMLSSRGGLGQWLLLAARMFRAPDVFAGVILLGLIGYSSTVILSLVESHVLRWRKRH
jgi:sulfonate transport system permease protein